MRLPSLDRLASDAVSILRRFPLELAAAAIAATAGVGMVGADDPHSWQRVLFAASLGIPLFLAVDLRAERKSWSAGARWVVLVAGAALLLLVWVERAAWPDRVALYRYLQLSAGLHLLVAISPYVGVRDPNGFWQYNKTLLLRFVTAAVFSAVLYAGLSVALLALDKLLGVDVEPETYGRLWFIVAFVFNTWYFLGGVASDFGALEQSTDYPTLLKVFSQFILVPIVAVYLTILTIYLGKVLITREWPSGWIGYLVSSVAVLGIFSLLLVHPIEERSENRWVRAYARGFYLALVPSIGMLLLAAWKRIDQYGITEPRYLLVVLAVWLAAIALYFGLTRSRRIKLVPATLCIGAFVTFVGPWGAYSVSLHSQTGRLEDLLERNGMLADGQARPAEGEVPFEDRREISAVVRYLVGTHGPASLEGLGGNLEAVARRASDSVAASESDRHRSDEEAARRVVAELGVPYVEAWATGVREPFRLSVAKAARAVPIADYTLAIRVSGTGSSADTVRTDGGMLVLRLSADSAALRIEDGDGVLAEIAAAPVVERARRWQEDNPAREHVPGDFMRADVASPGLRGDVWFTELTGVMTGSAGAGAGEETVRLRRWAADIFLAPVSPR